MLEGSPLSRQGPQPERTTQPPAADKVLLPPGPSRVAAPTPGCGPLTGTTTAQIQALPLQQLEALAVGAAFSAGVALLDFQAPADLAAWLAATT